MREKWPDTMADNTETVTECRPEIDECEDQSAFLIDEAYKKVSDITRELEFCLLPEDMLPDGCKQREQDSGLVNALQRLNSHLDRLSSRISL